MGEENSLIRDLPGPLRVLVRAILLAGALCAAFVSIFSFCSFVARLFWWQDLWGLLIVWGRTLPEFFMLAVQWTGWAFHQCVAAYHATIYPLVYWATSFFPFKLPTWAIDASFIVVFSIMASRRLCRVGNYIFGEGWDYWRDYGIYLPFWLVANLGTLILKAVGGIVWLISFGKFSLDDIYDALPHGPDDFVFGALSVSAVLLVFLGIDQLYLLYSGR